MMFQEELNVSQTFSVLTGEYICHNEKMWALCTEVLDPDDVYPKFLPGPVADKLRNICMYQFVDSEKFIRKSMSKFIHISHKDGQLLKASTNTKMPLTFAFLDTPASHVEWEKLVSVLGFKTIHLEKISQLFDLSSPTDIFVDHIFLDLDGNITGISCNPNRLNPEYLKDTDYSRITSGYYVDKKDTTYLDFDIHTDGTLGMYPEITYNSRNIAFPHDTRIDDSISPIGYSLKSGFKPVSNRMGSMQVRDNLVIHLRDGLNVINDDQAAWLFDLCDHEDQKLHISYKFNEDGSLNDIFAHRVEVENFEVWRA
jgi:hypothetical protein